MRRMRMTRLRMMKRQKSMKKKFQMIRMKKRMTNRAVKKLRKIQTVK